MPTCFAPANASPALEDNGEGVPGAEIDVIFRPIEIVAEGRSAVGVQGLDEDDWVVTAGMHLLRSDAPASARVHPTTWERVAGLQSLQREDLVRDFLEQQREAVREHGAEPPSQDLERHPERGRLTASASETHRPPT